MRLEVVEQELINSNTSDTFKISFSTHQPSANLEILVDDQKKKQIVQGYEDYLSFYSNCEKIADMDVLT